LAHAGYLDTRYDEYISDGVDIADSQRFTNAPRWTAGASAMLELPLRGGSRFSGRLDGHYQSKTYPSSELSEVLAQDGYTLWNATLAWHSPKGTWQVALSSQNLSDKAYTTSGFIVEFNDTLSRFYGPPRTTALSVTWSF
jgi:iron complex outermembrane receptor protein